MVSTWSVSRWSPTVALKKKPEVWRRPPASGIVMAEVVSVDGAWRVRDACARER